VKRPYIYPNCTITRWVDADTCVLQVDVGFKILVRVTCRLRSLTGGLNTREKGEPGAAEAAARVAELAPPGATVRLHSYELDRYGRTLGALITDDGVDIGAQLVADSYAAPWDGMGQRPEPPWPIPLAAA